MALLPRTKQLLAPFFSEVPWILEEADLRVRVPERLARIIKCASASSGLVKVGSNPRANEIHIHPEYYKPDTATGLALIAHELFHVGQRRVIPNFEEVFTIEAIRVERLGLMPWANGFEAPAYQFEQDVRARLIAQGLPAAMGSHLRRIF